MIVATYRYRAINDLGRSVAGRMSARSEVELHHLLQDAGLELVTCRDEARKRGIQLATRRIAGGEIIEVCIQLEQMLRAGVPLREALQEILNGVDSAVLRDTLFAVHKDICEGTTLSAALARHNRIFDSVFVALIESGEQSGKLDQAIHQLVSLLRWRFDMAARAKKALRYPAFMGIVVVGVTMFMMLFVVPQVMDFLLNSNEVLPIQTMLLVDFSNFLQAYWWLILLVPTMTVFGVRIGKKKSAPFRLAYDRAVLKTPVLGQVVRMLSLARFASVMAILYRSGVPILRSLEICITLLDNMSLRQAIELVRHRISAGESLSHAIQSTGEFPSMSVRMIAVGETTGELDKMLKMVAEEFDRKSDDAVQRLIGMIEPTLTLVMGGLMAWIALAVFGPIYDTVSTIEF